TDQCSALSNQGQTFAQKFAVHYRRGHDHLLGQVSTGYLPQEGQRLRHRSSGVRRSQRLGNLELHGHWVDRDHNHRARHHRSLHCVDADPADSHHNNGVARSYVSPDSGRAPPGCNSTTHQRDGIEGEVGINLYDRALSDTSVLAKGSDLRHEAYRTAINKMAVGPVGDHPTHKCAGTAITEILTSGRAVPATATAGQKAGGNMVSHSNGVYLRAN